jgi:hypothetical protein
LPLKRPAAGSRSVIALSTNVVVRQLGNDDALQARRARALVAAGADNFVVPTVLMECE